MNVNNDCIIPNSARIESGVIFGQRVILAGENIVIRANARLDTACVIAEGVTVGQGAWVRAGAVVRLSCLVFASAQARWLVLVQS